MTIDELEAKRAASIWRWSQDDGKPVGDMTGDDFEVMLARYGRERYKAGLDAAETICEKRRASVTNVSDYADGYAMAAFACKDDIALLKEKI